MRRATAARLVLGGACLVAPGGMLALIGGPDRHEPSVRLVARVLGARLLLQAGLDLALGPRTRTPGVAVEVTHATSMLPVAVLSGRHRRIALVSAAAAAVVALLDLVGGAGAPGTGPREAVLRP